MKKNKITIILLLVLLPLISVGSYYKFRDYKVKTQIERNLPKPTVSPTQTPVNEAKYNDFEIYYFYDLKGDLQLAQSFDSGFEKLKETYLLYYLTKISGEEKYFSTILNPILDETGNSIYLGISKYPEVSTAKSCQYSTDILKVNLNTHYYDIVYKHSDCSDSYPNIAPAKPISVVNSKYLVLSTALCSECDSDGNTPEQIQVVNMENKKSVFLGRAMIKEINIEEGLVTFINDWRLDEGKCIYFDEYKERKSCPFDFYGEIKTLNLP